MLAPFGWFVHDDSQGDLLAFSAVVDGHRADYVDSPAHLYAEPRGRFVRFDKLACDGPLIALRREAGAFEVIPVAGCRRFGMAFDGRAAAATAWDEAGHEIGPAT